jgi:septal ring factor EnvC (AmiA/AmiB activator)
VIRALVLTLALALLAGNLAAQGSLDALNIYTEDECWQRFVKPRDEELREYIAKQEAEYKKLLQTARAIRDRRDELLDERDALLDERDALLDERDALREGAFRLERQAQIAAACDYGLDLCPSAWTEAGRSALESGQYSGGGLLFWSLVALKLAAFAVPVGLFLVLLWHGSKWLWLHLTKPKMEAVERAKAEIQRAQNSAAEERKAIESAQLELSQWQEGIEQAEKQLDARRASVEEIDARIAARQAEVDELEAKVSRLEARRAAMLGH